MNDKVKKILQIRNDFCNGKILLIHDVKRNDFKDLEKKLKDNRKCEVIILDYKNIDNIYNDLKTYNKNTIIITNKGYDELDKFKEDCFLINFDRITAYNYYLFLANFEEYNFNNLSDEMKDKSYEGIIWNNGNNRNINLGDYVYVYYYNVPDGINRILLKAQVIDDGYHFGENNARCLDENNKQGIRIKYITVFDDKKDRLKFSKSNLEEYGITINNYNSKQPITNVKLINALDEFAKKHKSTLSEFKNNFNCTCAFKDFQFNERGYNHNTFEKENGFQYYEVHHLIEQHNTNGNTIKDSSVYNPYNEFSLCANCHRRIHWGKIEDRKQMVKYLYNQNRNEIDKLLDDIPEDKFKGISNVSNKKLFWLLSQYVKPEDINEQDLV